MNPGIIFALVAAVAFGLWTVFHKHASAGIDYLAGAIIISLTAVIVGLVILLPRIKTVVSSSTPKGILFAVLAGFTVLAIDYFALKAYGSGLSISVAGPIILGGGVAVAAFLGLLLGESITLIKILGILLIVAGTGILSRLG